MVHYAIFYNYETNHITRYSNFILSRHVSDLTALSVFGSNVRNAKQSKILVMVNVVNMGKVVRKKRKIFYYQKCASLCRKEEFAELTRDNVWPTFSSPKRYAFGQRPFSSCLASRWHQIYWPVFSWRPPIRHVLKTYRLFWVYYCVLADPTFKLRLEPLCLDSMIVSKWTQQPWIGESSIPLWLRLFTPFLL